MREELYCYKKDVLPHHEQPKQKFEHDLKTIQNIFAQIQVACAINDTTKTLFEAADNWNMSLEKHIKHLQAYLEDINIEPAKKNALAAGMLQQIINFKRTLEEQASLGKSAQDQPIKKVKEELNQFFIKTVKE
ncbi:MAG: hypothetical protein KA054_02295 [Candidatus Moranbacteria bacterium]|nr:hypothetical protein [Candidatus Moranbacteria bacterium]